jgi:hypothetical protein
MRQFNLTICSVQTFAKTRMPAPTIPDKGQIAVSRDLHLHVGATPGQQVVVDELSHGAVALRAKPMNGLDAFAGCLPRPRKTLSVEEMNTITSDAWAG